MWAKGCILMTVCVCFTWLDMTIPPWCRQKVMVYYYYLLKLVTWAQVLKTWCLQTYGRNLMSTCATEYWKAISGKQLTINFLKSIQHAGIQHSTQMRSFHKKVCAHRKHLANWHVLHFGTSNAYAWAATCKSCSLVSRGRLFIYRRCFWLPWILYNIQIIHADPQHNTAIQWINDSDLVFDARHEISIHVLFSVPVILNVRWIVKS